MMILLVVHAAAILAIGVLLDFPLVHVAMESTAVAAFALIANQDRLRSGVRAAAAVSGLLLSSALLIHLTGGAAEGHIHFFVVVGLASLYESWGVFLLAVGGVLAHHLAFAFIAPAAIYQDPSAIADPFAWTFAHAAFLVGIGVCYLVAWRLNEDARRRQSRSLQELRDAEAKYRGIIENAVEGSFEADADGRLLRVNPALARMVGYTTPEELLDSVSHCQQLYSDPTQRLDMRLLDAQGAIRDLEVRLRHRAGSVVWALVSSRAVRDEDGRLAGHEGMVVDITERRHHEAALREAEERFRSAFDNAPIGMHLSDREGRFLQVNRAFCAMVGYSEESLLTMRFQEITLPEDLSKQLELRDRAIAGETDGFAVEKRFVHRAGHEVWAALSASIVRGDDGEVLYLVTQLQDITQRKQSEMMLTHMALHDAVTGLPNRVLLLDRVAQALERTRRSGAQVGLLFLDLDRFKIINDSLGHEAGDRLLRAVAERLRAIMRPSDTVARLGGDEFVVLCEGLDESASATHVAQRITDAMGRPFDLPDGELFVTTSIGIALASGPEDAPETLLRDADAAMYRAKEGGRDRFELFDASMRDQAVERLHTERALRRALERGEFRVYYQPIVDVAAGGTIGVEALLRWEHPERGLVSPDEFIPLAEETGLIVPIGAWVLQEACRQAQIWRGADPSRPALRVSVNLSARQLADPGLTAMVEAALTSTETDPSQLWLEITESVLTGDTESTVQALRDLKALGVRLCVDDFGTGYSSLLYLKRFPVDTLKVDRSFVSGLGQDAEDSAIVAGVIGLAHTLGLGTVAEGVEGEAQLLALRDLGCQLAQGYLFARPEPAGALPAETGAASR